MASDNNKADLIAQAVSGDSVALETLLFQHRQRLMAYVRQRFPKILQGTFEPQDIVQDTWLRAIHAIQGFHPNGSDSVYRWLVTIARNQIADKVKHQRSRNRQHVGARENYDPDDMSVVRLLEELAVHLRTPSKSAANRELLLALDRAINKLPTDQAKALRLRHLERMGVKDVAAKMARTEGSVLMLCNRALKALRLELRSASLYN